MFRIIGDIEHITAQLAKAHSILNTLSDYFESEDDVRDLPRKAKDLSNLIVSANDYVEDSIVSAVSAMSRAQSIVNSDLSEIEEILRKHFEQKENETPIMPEESPEAQGEPEQ